MVVSKDHDALNELGDAPSVPFFSPITLKEPLQVISCEIPGTESHDLIEFAKPCQSRVNFLTTFCDPSQVTALQHELLFQYVQQVVALIAADGHYSKVKLLVSAHDVTVVLAVADDLVIHVRIELQVLREPAKNAFMRSDPTMFKEKAIENRFQVNLLLRILAHDGSEISFGSWPFSDDFACHGDDVSGQFKHLWTLGKTEECRDRILCDEDRG